MINWFSSKFLCEFRVTMFRKYLKNAVKTPQSAICKEAGFTLLEAAIGLVIIGLITVPLMQMYKINLVQESLSRTRGSLANIEDAINQYHATDHFVYPCPASVSLSEGQANFGASVDCSILASLKLCTSPTWSTTEGICKTDDTTDAVIIGAVPFSHLKMQQEKALDFWGNKILYAVTFEQTNIATFTTNNGTIRVKAVDNPAAIQAGTEDGIPEEKTSSVDFFLFSTGSSGVGGYTKDGVLIQACGDATTGFEHENCDFDDIFFYKENPNDDDAGAYSEVLGASFFDDITRAQLSLPEPLWFPHPDNGTYTEDYLLTLSTHIGIGPEPITNPAEAIEVQGNIRINGMLKSNEICNITEADCFAPELITGEMDEMKCDPVGDTMDGYQAVMELSSGQVHCNSPVDSSNAPIDGVTLQVDTSVIHEQCPPWHFVSGITPSGAVICVDQNP